MARYKPYQYDQMVMVPISFPEQLAPGTLESSIQELVEHHLDLSVFEARYQNDSTGARAIHPKLLLKVILFGYSRGTISSRQTPALACGAIVEPAFANLRIQKRLDHFTLRSKAKVDVQWKLFALVHNIGKIHRYGRLL